jgi:mono/diheme cytochrome c family protein
MIYSIRTRFKLKIHILLLVFALGITNLFAYEPTSIIDVNDEASLTSIKKGEELYKANCTSCHAIDKKLIGPALKDVWTRWGSEEDLIAWIRNNQAFLATGDPYANALYAEYNQSPMNAFLQFTDADITSIIDYIRANQSGVYPVGVTGSTGSTGTATPTTTSAPSSTILWVLIGFLAIVFLLLARVVSKLDRLNKEKQGIEVDEPEPLLNRLLNKKVLSAFGILIMIFVGYSIVKGAVNLGRSQGYAPEQPIKFSHAVHAGQNQIDCQYCHTGAEDSKHANIPSVNVCMNCHKYVQEGPKYGPDEINKIYAASGWDKDSLKFTAAAKPIKWVKIHNLPDHVYFNHSQHVTVGKIACQTCHGNVQEMEVVQQFAPLSMGWCVNCHRETDIQFKDNQYYETTFDRYHKELKDQSRNGVTVNDIGGTECQKCHY